MERKPGNRFRVLAAVALAGGWAALAQTTGGGLEGKIVDQSGRPIPGVLIQVTGPCVQGYLGAASDADGQYLLGFVPVGTGYEVKAEAEGYATVVRKGIEVPLNTTVNLPFTMGAGKTEIVVTAAASIIEPKSSRGGSSLSDRMIQAIPLQRDANQLVFLAPGAVAGGPSTPGMASILGSTGAENAYLVNGVDVTNTNWGTGTGTTGCDCAGGIGPRVVAGAQMGSTINFDFILDQQVMAGGVPPEYGWSMGGIVNSITRSGGNELHGGLFAYYWNDNLQAASKTYPYSSTTKGNGGYTRYDVGGSLGGYFVKDKLWFYLAYDYNRMQQYTDVPAGPGFGDYQLYLKGRPAQSVFAGQRIRDTSEINQQFAFNLTWMVSPNHRLSLVVFGNQDKVDGYGSLARITPEGSTYSALTRPTNLSLQWRATWTPRFFSEAVVSYHTSTQTPTLTSMGGSNLNYYYLNSGFHALPKDQTVAPGYANGGATVDLGTNYQPSHGFGTYVGIDEDTSWQMRLKATNLLSAAGRHEFSYGLQYDDRRYTPAQYQSGRTDFVSPGTGLTAVGGLKVWWYPAELAGWPVGPGGRQYLYGVDEFYSPPAMPTAMRTWSAWANDDWSITDHFTLKLGLRYDEERVEGKLPGSLAIDLTGNYAPRLGFAWDVAHNGKSKFYGFAGRYFQRVPTDIAVVALNNYQSGFEIFYDPQLTVWSGYWLFKGGAGVQVQGQNPRLPVTSPLKAPYTDEYLLGFDYEVLPDLRLGARLIYRTLGRSIDDLSYDGGRTYVVANMEGWTGIPTPGLNWDWSYNYNETYYFPKPTRIYRALELTAVKRFSNNWQLGASYVLSRLEGNYEGSVMNDTRVGVLQPNITPAFDLAQFLVNGYGLLPLDRTHVLKAYGSYQFRNIPLLLAANFSLQSGTPISRQIEYGWYSGMVGFADARGSNGRTPTTWALDLAAEYAFSLPMRNWLAVRLDIFNVTNNQVTTAVDQAWQFQPWMGDPLLMNNSLWSKPYEHQPPRLVRLGLRWTF